MSKVEFHDPVRTMRGKFEKEGKMILRKKTFRTPTGKVLGEGVQESYAILNPRDYKKKPPKNAELANMRSFAESKRISSDIINSEKFSDDDLAAMTLEQRARVLELRQQLEDFRERFYKQFKQPDPEAPFIKKLPGGASAPRRKQYMKLDNFIQAIVRERQNQTS